MQTERKRKRFMGDSFITTTGADASGAQYRYKPVLVITLLENTRDFPEIITSTGAEFWCNSCPSVLVLVIFQALILGTQAF